jgi:hypothetical protein
VEPLGPAPTIRTSTVMPIIHTNCVSIRGSAYILRAPMRVGQ